MAKNESIKVSPKRLFRIALAKWVRINYILLIKKPFTYTEINIF